MRHRRLSKTSPFAFRLQHFPARLPQAVSLPEAVCEASARSAPTRRSPPWRSCALTNRTWGGSAKDEPANPHKFSAADALRGDWQRRLTVSVAPRRSNSVVEHPAVLEMLPDRRGNRSEAWTCIPI